MTREELMIAVAHADMLMSVCEDEGLSEHTAAHLFANALCSITATRETAHELDAFDHIRHERLAYDLVYYIYDLVEGPCARNLDALSALLTSAGLKSLPSSYNTLDILTRLDVVEVNKRIKSGDIHPTMTQADARALLPKKETKRKLTPHRYRLGRRRPR